MNISKSIVKFFVPVSILLSVVGCSGNTGHDNTSDTNALSPQQEALVADGWYIPKTTPAGELSKEYGIKDKYGQQDNYFDIQIGNGCDVAVKIVDAVTDKCIRYVFVLENSTENIQMIPQGKYYLKLAYGKDWMEYDNGDGTISGKFTRNVSYDKSVDIFDFGKKNSSSIVSYVLQINVENSKLQNNFGTVAISEADFME
ncbi:hypothetical protein [uncultured Duncaniella sp.]|uniref:hypothetical protein n=1 Tax=uncultured Duncaniella sp. TaxID=2768039 RepID=UPI0025A96AC8|nr:hypothetical protein [uncultured Duncaniella sp.]